MTDQTPQTTTEPDVIVVLGAPGYKVTLRYDRASEKSKHGISRGIPNNLEYALACEVRDLRATRTTPQPLAVGLDREAVRELIWDAVMAASVEVPDTFTDRTEMRKEITQNTLDAILALVAPAEGYVLVPVDRLRDIVTLSSFLRQGGCDAEDLAGLEYAVESAVDIASDLLPAAPTGETL